MASDTPSPKPAPHFPAPEWTSVSAHMAAQFAHEIRNPLLSIKGAAQLLERSVSEEDKSLATLIISEVSRIDALIATLDPLTPNPTHMPTALNIHELTEYVRKAVLPYAGEVKIIVDYDPSIPEISGLREPLIQALLNVLKNAVEAAALGQNPTVIITTRYLLGERMQRSGTVQKLPIAISIADNGAGVPDEMLPRLFTPFTTNKAEGKGLGLAIVAKIIEEHGGLIAHDKPTEGGARFTLYLPQA